MSRRSSIVYASSIPIHIYDSPIPIDIYTWPIPIHIYFARTYPRLHFIHTMQASAPNSPHLIQTSTPAVLPSAARTVFWASFIQPHLLHHQHHIRRHPLKHALSESALATHPVLDPSRNVFATSYQQRTWINDVAAFVRDTEGGCSGICQKHS